jgi:hypothetical protein
MDNNYQVFARYGFFFRVYGTLWKKIQLLPEEIIIRVITMENIEKKK